MEFDVSDKQASFGRRPHIKKGYYPAQLLSVEPFLDSDGNPKESKYGRQVLFNFAIYKVNEKGAPVEPMTYAPEEGADPVNVTIPKFLYYMSKDKEPGKFRTAVTPNSKITKALKALGWEFDATKTVKMDDYIGNWVEVNIDDYEHTDNQTEEKYKASTIKDVSKYEGPIPDSNLEKVDAPQKRVEATDTSKQLKHEDLHPKKPEDTVESLQEKIKQLDMLKEEGNLTPDGHKQAVENINAKIEALKPKSKMGPPPEELKKEADKK